MSDTAIVHVAVFLMGCCIGAIFGIHGTIKGWWKIDE